MTTSVALKEINTAEISVLFFNSTSLEYYLLRSMQSVFPHFCSATFRNVLVFCVLLLQGVIEYISPGA